MFETTFRKENKKTLNFHFNRINLFQKKKKSLFCTHYKTPFASLISILAKEKGDGGNRWKC